MKMPAGNPGDFYYRTALPTGFDLYENRGFQLFSLQMKFGIKISYRLDLRAVAKARSVLNAVKLFTMLLTWLPSPSANKDGNVWCSFLLREPVCFTGGSFNYENVLLYFQLKVDARYRATHNEFLLPCERSSHV